MFSTENFTLLQTMQFLSNYIPHCLTVKEISNFLKVFQLLNEITSYY